MEFILFMVFSIIESFAFFSITVSLYRLKFESYFKPLLLLSTIVNLVSFYMRKETDLAAYAPLAILILLILFFMAVIRIPAFWAFVVALTGYIAFAVLQTLLMLVSFGFLSVSEINDHEWKGYLLQTISGVVGYMISRILYKRGFGFSFEFNKLGLKWATIILMPVFIAIAITGVTVLLFKNLFIAAITLIIGLIILLYYALRKDKTDANLSI